MNNPKTDKETLSASEAAQLLGTHVETVRRLARRSEIPSFKVGRDWRFRKEALTKWVENQYNVKKPQRVLVIDDEEPIRHWANHYLTKEGYEVLEAKEGFEGLLITKSNKIDLILLDLRMPKMNGPEFLQKMRENGLNIPTIIITGYPEGSLVMEAMKHGPVTLLAKPTDKEMLLQAVRAELNNAYQQETAVKEIP